MQGPATTSAWHASFSPNIDLGTIRVQASGEARDFLLIDTMTVANIKAGTVTDLGGRVSIPEEVLPGTYGGALEVLDAESLHLLGSVAVTLTILEDRAAVPQQGGLLLFPAGSAIIPPGALPPGHALALRPSLSMRSSYTPASGLDVLRSVFVSSTLGAFATPIDVSFQNVAGPDVESGVLVFRRSEEWQDEFVGVGTVRSGTLVTDQSEYAFHGISRDGHYVFCVASFAIGFVTGTVRNALGVPVAEARVRVNDVACHAITDANGAYVLPAPLGNVYVTVNHTSALATTSDTLAYGSALAWIGPLTRHVTLDISTSRCTSGPGELDTDTDSLLGWEVAGDVRAVPAEGEIEPLQGSSLFRLGTGGVAQGGVVSTLSRCLAVPSGATQLALSYRFLSEEFPEFRNRGYNDAMVVSVTQAGGVQSSTAYADIDSSPPEDVVPMPSLDYPGGDDTVEGTRWRTAVEQIRVGVPWVSVVIEVRDNGDALYDSVVLVDAIEFRQSCPSPFLGAPLEPPSEGDATHADGSVIKYQGALAAADDLVTTALFDHARDNRRSRSRTDEIVVYTGSRSTLAEDRLAVRDNCVEADSGFRGPLCAFGWSTAKTPALPRNYAHNDRLEYDGHNGIDFRTTDKRSVICVVSGELMRSCGRTLVYAAASGYVSVVDDRGNGAVYASETANGTLRIRHWDGHVERDLGHPRWTTLYAHLEEFLLEDEARDARGLQRLRDKGRHGHWLVEEGEVIGISGDRGVEGQPHLHFGVANRDQDRVDPYGWEVGLDPDPFVRNCRLWR